MSFTKEVKAEILSHKINGNANKIARLSGIVHSAGSININFQGLNFSISSENKKLLKHAADIITTEYDEEIEITAENGRSLNKTTLYTLSVSGESANKILIDIGILSKNEEGFMDIKYGAGFLQNEEEIKNFIIGVFLGSGIVQIPQKDKSKGSYHLEFSLGSEELADDLVEFLKQFNFFCKKVVRKNNFVLYFKESEQISDLLAFLGATSSMLTLQSVMVERFMRNKITRESNCVVANIDKVVEAGIKQIDAIETIEKTIGLDKLDDKLREMALIRKEHPDESIEELRSYFEQPIGKSGVNHRLRKLIQIADNIKGGNLNGI